MQGCRVLAPVHLVRSGRVAAWALRVYGTTDAIE